MAKSATVKGNKVTFNGKTYYGSKSKGKVAVRVQRTAHGQNQVAGIYHIAEHFWQETKANVPLPLEVRAEFEKIFGNA